MQWSKISIAGLFVVGLSIPALFGAPSVASAGVNIYVVPSGGYVTPYGGVRRAAQSIGRAVVRSQIRRKVRSKIRKKYR